MSIPRFPRPRNIDLVISGSNDDPDDLDARGRVIAPFYLLYFTERRESSAEPRRGRASIILDAALSKLMLNRRSGGRRGVANRACRVTFAALLEASIIIFHDNFNC